MTAPDGSGRPAAGLRPEHPIGDRVLYATDLDRTLIFSARAAVPLPAARAGAAGGLVAVERYGGRDISFVTATQLDLLAQIQRRCLVVPATTRTLAQYERVAVWADRPPAWAIVANGGILLRHGTPEGGWTRAVRELIAEQCHELAAVTSWLAGVAHRWIDRVRVAEDLFLYTLVDRAGLPAEAATEWAAHLASWGWGLSIQGRKLYAVPGPLTKSAAVREVARREGVGRVIAAGDSLLDRELLEGADVSLRPAHGELHEIGAPAHVVTVASGAAAGEELLRTVLSLLAGGPEHDEVFGEAGGRVPPAERDPVVRAGPA